jgi:CRISPR/Cas system CSM-associated protein Csm3 (group 7 of RAMP superfamily)
MHEVRIDLTFSMESPFHTSADRIKKGVHKSTYVREIFENCTVSIPAIPATTIKGTLRARLEYLLNGINKSDAQEIIDNTFGNPHKRSPLIFQDATFEGSVIIRPGVQIDRKRRISLEQHLFTLEVADGDEFENQITGYFNTYNDALSSCAAIWIAATFCKGFGGGRSRGLGWCTLKKFNAKIDEKDISLEKIKQKAKEVLQCKKNFG